MPGRVHDKGTGLHYNRARYYDARIGQFLSPDPIRAVDLQTGEINLAALQNPQRLNPYAYALNSPYRYVDPTGLEGDEAGGIDPSSVAVNAAEDFEEGTRGRTEEEITREGVEALLLGLEPITPFPNFFILSIISKSSKAVKSIVKISNVAGDWASKGAHIKIKGVELSVKPGKNGSIVLKSVFSRDNAKNVSNAIKIAEEALNDKAFRQRLHDASGRAIQLLKQGNQLDRSRAGELRFLQKALEKRSP